MSDPQTPPVDPTLQPEPVVDEMPRRSRNKVIVIVVAAVVVFALAFGGVLWALSAFAPKTGDPATVSETPGIEQPTDVEGVSYENAQHGYSVVFPGAPSETTQKLPIQGFEIDLVSALWQEDNSALAANATTFPEELLGDVDTMLQGSIDGAIANVPGAVLTSSSPTTLDGIPAIEAEATSTAGDLHMIIAIDVDTQYQLLALGTDEATEDAFFASFARS